MSCRVATDATQFAISPDALSDQRSGDQGLGDQEPGDQGLGEVAAGDVGEDLPALGPIPGASHWHAGYVVRVCDEVLEPLQGGDDPLGIHSHGDGVMHVHPFFEESGYENATLKLFNDALGLSLSEGSMTLPDGRTFIDGDMCGDRPGRVFVDRWADLSPDTAVERIFDNPEDTRYVADGELYQIAFAPADSFPVVPPSAALVRELSDLDRTVPEPWVDTDPSATIDTVRVWQVAAANDGACTPDQIAERVRSGTPLCFTPNNDGLSGSEAFSSARAVMLNRQPAVETRITSELRDLIRDHFASSEDLFVLAVEIDGAVITTPGIAMLPVSEDRLVISGGLTEETARQLATTLSQ